MFPLLQYFDILWKCLLGPLLEPLYKKCFLQLVTESGMTRAFTGTLPSSALREAPLIPVLLIFNLLFPNPNPCLALPSPFPSRPPLLCGKISRNLVVCSPGHHQVVLRPWIKSPPNLHPEIFRLQASGLSWLCNPFSVKYRMFCHFPFFAFTIV